MVQAQLKSPHPDQPVTLVVVTKNRCVAEIEQVVAQRELIMGENRVQELRDKYPLLTENVNWHLIGHLQQNKVKYITDKVQLIHSLENIDLAEEINKRMAAEKRIMPCLVQVNMLSEERKYGLSKDEVRPFLEKVSTLPFLQIDGLMNIAPNFTDPEEARSGFRMMYQLFEEIKTWKIARIRMDILSMGMSHDFAVAIEEGANMIRVGSRIFL